MKSQRDLKVCVAVIQAALTRDGLEPEQKNALESALRNIRQLRRSSSLDRARIYRVVRAITEELVKAFVRRD